MLYFENTDELLKIEEELEKKYFPDGLDKFEVKTDADIDLLHAYQEERNRVKREATMLDIDTLKADAKQHIKFFKNMMNHRAEGIRRSIDEGSTNNPGTALLTPDSLAKGFYEVISFHISTLDKATAVANAKAAADPDQKKYAARLRQTKSRLLKDAERAAASCVYWDGTTLQDPAKKDRDTLPAIFSSSWHAISNDIAATNRKKFERDGSLSYRSTSGWKYTIKKDPKKDADLLAQLGPSAHRIMMMIFYNMPIEQIENNGHVTRLNIPLEVYAEAIGADIFPKETANEDERAAELIRVKNATQKLKRDIMADLATLSSIHVSGRGRSGGMVEFGLILNVFEITPGKNPQIVVNISPETKSFMKGNFYITQYHKVLLSIPATKPNAYIMGNLINQHLYMPTNIERGTAHTYGVEALLKHTNIPSYESMKDADGKMKRGYSWQKRIKEPFENGLNDLKACGFLKEWEYKGKGSDTLQDLSYYQWSNLNIVYSINNEADTSEYAKYYLESKRSAEERHKEKRDTEIAKLEAKEEMKRRKSGKKG